GHGADRREAGQVRLDRVDLALVRRAHRTPSRIECHVRCAALPAMLGELAKPGGEDLLEPAADLRGAGVPIERLEAPALPELVLEAIGVARDAAKLEHLEEDLPPGPQRQDREQADDALDDDRRVNDQRQEGEVGMDVHSLSIEFTREGGFEDPRKRLW